MIEQNEPRPRRAAIRRFFIPASIGLGLLVSALMVECGLRAYLAYRLRGSLETSVRDDPRDRDPRRVHWLGTMVYPVDNPDIVYRLKPNLRGIFEGHLVETNSIGLRDAEVPAPKPRGELRIAAVGDSSTFGWGVRGEESWPKVLERAYRNLAGSDRDVRVINCGMPGYNAVQEAAFFSEVILPMEPDAVVILYDHNDTIVPAFLIDLDFLALDHLYAADLPAIFSGAFFRGGKALKVYAQFGHPVEGGGPFEMDEKIIPPKYRHLYGWKNLEDAYRRLAATCREARIPLYVLIPTVDVYSGYSVPVDTSYGGIRKLCAELGIATIETYDLVHGMAQRLGLTNKDISVDDPRDVHPNAFRQALMAEATLAKTDPRLLPKLPAEGIEREVTRVHSEALARYADLSLYPPEEIDGATVSWAKPSARLIVRTPGDTYFLRYRTPGAGLSPGTPLDVHFKLQDCPEQSRRHDAPGVHEIRFELPPNARSERMLEITTGRAFHDPVTRRDFGIAVESRIP